MAGVQVTIRPEVLVDRRKPSSGWRRVSQDMVHPTIVLMNNRENRICGPSQAPRGAHSFCIVRGRGSEPDVPVHRRPDSAIAPPPTPIRDELRGSRNCCPRTTSSPCKPFRDRLALGQSRAVISVNVVISWAGTHHGVVSRHVNSIESDAR
jgi:hypothetical protein